MNSLLSTFKVNELSRRNKDLTALSASASTRVTKKVVMGNKDTLLLGSRGGQNLKL